MAQKVYRLKPVKENLAFAIALVESPANGVEFIRLSQVEKPERVLLSINEQERILHGPIFRADHVFERLHPVTKERILAYFTAEDIKDIVLQASKDGTLSRFLLDHGGRRIDDLVLLESYRVTKDRPETINGVSLSPGSWMVSLQATTPEAWSALSNIKQKGFSPEYWCIYEEVENNQLPKLNLSKIMLIKDAKERVTLMNILLKNNVISKTKLESIETDRGTLTSVNEEETIADGVAVVLIDAEGNAVVPEDGEYISADFIYTVADGIVTSKVAKTEETPAEEAELSAKQRAAINQAVLEALQKAGVQVKPDLTKPKATPAVEDEKIANLVKEALKPVSTELSQVKAALKNVDTSFIKADQQKKQELANKAKLSIFKPRYNVH